MVISICIFPPIIYFVIIGWFIYEYFYFKSDKFLKIKNSIKENTKKCNELNAHIEDLKRAYINIKQIDYGQANYIDNSKYNYKRPELKRIQENKKLFTQEELELIEKNIKTIKKIYILGLKDLNDIK